MVCFGCLDDVILMVLGSHVGEYLWTVDNVGIYALFEVMGRRDVDLGPLVDLLCVLP